MRNKPPTVEIEGDFVVVDGMRIAKRGRPDSSQAKTWVSLEPGWTVVDRPPDQIEVSHDGVGLGLKHAPHQPERSPEPVVTAAPAEPDSLWPMPEDFERALSGEQQSEEQQSGEQQPIPQRSQKSASKATDMAGKQIDKLGDASATNEERQSRKRRLLKGPKEFRDIREKALAEQPKRKK
jgi:hypothetical protein